MRSARGGRRAATPSSKLKIPRLPGNVIPRTSLLGTINDGEAAGARVTAVLAPAGSGKTVLLAQRCAQLLRGNRTVAWLSLDKSDNDPVVFWSDMLGAVDQAVGSGLSNGRPHRTSAAFVEVVHAQRDPLWLVLDDLHEIDPGPVIDDLDQLVRHLPDGLAIMLGSRFDPPLPLARLILEGRGTEVRFKDLAFDRAETDTLLLGHGVHLGASQVALLLRRTEGWAAGLRLAAMSMSHAEDPGAFVVGFVGDERPVADYLVGEVLSHMSAETERFLLATAVPERFTVDLARELSGRDDAGAQLDLLERVNALIEREGRRWYRYHTLLRGYLLAELGRREPIELRRLNGRTADWFASHGLPGVALDHAAAAQDWARVVSIIEQRGLGMVLSGEWPSLVQSLPAEVAVPPKVALITALAAAWDGDLESARAQLDRVGREPAAHADPPLRILHAAVLLQEARRSGDGTAPLGELIGLAGQTGMDPPDMDLETLAAASRGTAWTALGQCRRAEADLASALRIARLTSRDYVVLDCLVGLASNSAEANDLAGMVRWADEAIGFASALGWASAPHLGEAYTAKAWVACQTLDREQAARYASLAEELSSGDAAPEVALATTAVSTIVAFDAGTDRRTALERLRKCWRVVDGIRLRPTLVALVCGAEQAMALRIGETEWAAEAARRADHRLPTAGDPQVFHAVMHAHAGRRAAARKTLGAVLSGEIACRAVNSEIIAWLLEAAEADAAGEENHAYEAAARALELGAVSGAARNLGIASARVAALLIRNQGRFGRRNAFLNELLALTRTNGDRPVPVPSSGERLTERELDILNDLPSLLSLEEIARAHVISVNTVKTHLRAVYRKLGVGSRREAVGRARGLDLILVWCFQVCLRALRVGADIGCLASGQRDTGKSESQWRS